MAEPVLITGITGQLGRAIFEHLPERKEEVACILRKDASSYDIDLSSMKILYADISDRKSLFKYVKEMNSKVKTIIHMAAVGHGYPEKEIRDTVLSGAINLYDFAREIGCEKYIFLSSILAAGWVPRGMSSLDETCNPRKKDLCYFGKMKLQAEGELLRMAEGGTPKVVVLRLGNVYGPPTKLSFVKYVADIVLKKNKMFYFRAKDSVMWAPVYIQDVIDCIFYLLDKSSFENSIYFLTGSEHATLEEIMKLVSNALHISVKDMNLGPAESVKLFIWQALDLVRAFVGRPSFPDFIYSNKKMEVELGFLPKMKLGEGVKRTVEWGLSKGAF